MPSKSAARTEDLREAEAALHEAALHEARSKTLAAAMVMLGERLTPARRAAHVLREAFGHPYRPVAEILGQSWPARGSWSAGPAGIRPRRDVPPPPPLTASGT